MNSKPNNRELGLALIALIMIILILGVIAYAFVRIVSTHRLASVDAINSIKAFYISEGALEIGKKYLADQVGGPPSWAPHTILYSNEPLGDGYFSLEVYWDESSGFFSFTSSGTIN